MARRVNVAKLIGRAKKLLTAVEEVLTKLEDAGEQPVAAEKEVCECSCDEKEEPAPTPEEEAPRRRRRRRARRGKKEEASEDTASTGDSEEQN